MNFIKEMRLQTGLSQQYLAAFLNISRSQLSMAENNNRDLPPAVRQQLYQIADLLGKSNPSGAPDGFTASYKQEVKGTATALKKYAAKCRRKADTLLKQLTAIEERHAMARNLLQNLSLLKTMVTQGPALKKQTLVLELAAQEAKISLQKPDSLQLAMLQLKIAGLNAEATKALALALALSGDAA